MTFAPGRNRPAPSATVVRVEKRKVVLALPSRREIALNYYGLTPSMSAARGKSKSVRAIRYLFEPMTSALDSPMDRYLPLPLSHPTAHLTPTRVSAFRRIFANGVTATW